MATPDEQNVNRLGEVESVMSIEQDRLRCEIEGRQEAEVLLRKANDQLLERDRDLEKTRRDLDERNADLQRFAHVASHDLREPLRSIKGFSDLLARRYEGQLDGQADEWIGFLHRGVIRMQSLLDDLLAYSRVSGSASSFKPVCLDDALDAALENLTAAKGDRQISIVRSPLPTIEADFVLMVVLLQNLVGNAIKFSREHDPGIWIGAYEKDREEILFVRDNGIGIPVEHRERIFEVFQRLHRESEYPGTGIGLALCRRIAERHAGRLWLTSEVGEGSTFFFSMPMKPEPE